ncbi:MAG: hypothetical protein EOO20_09190 [Chryseobacterium sp.]|nr:MAG: hypothetical protein EOO20_09190 [Chryseobacterium sp.]
MNALFSVLMVLELMFVFPLVGTCQNSRLAGHLDMVREKNPFDGRIVYAITLTLENQGEVGVYLPNQLLRYDEQLSDSIVIYKRVKGIYLDYKVIHPLIARQSPPFVSGNVFYQPMMDYNYLTNKYWGLFEAKKREAEQMVNQYERLNGKFTKSFNPLFLKARERFRLYVIGRTDFYVDQPGRYKIRFFHRQRAESAGHPEWILDYHKLVVRTFYINDYYFRVAGKRTKRVILNVKGR